MYTPKFTITPKITQDIEKIGAVFGYLAAVQLPESYKKELVAKAAAESIHASTAIEGNTLTQKQVREVLGGKPPAAQAKEIKEVENYSRALKDVGKLGRQKDFAISEQAIKNVHRTLLAGIKEEIARKYRQKQVVVGDYLPPDYRQVPSLVDQLISWINNPLPQNLSPILCAGIAHFQFVAIHPFEDGNGRTARLLTILLLIINNYDIVRFFALESYYNRDRKAYYQALSSADKYRIDRQPDLTKWLEYFVYGILVESERTKYKIEEMVVQNIASQNQQYLSENQRKTLKLAIQKGAIKTADTLRATGLSRKGVYNILEKLVKLGLLKSEGVGKGTFYKITAKGLGYTK